MSSRAKDYMTPEEFLAFERAAETKHEYYDGVVVAMAGGGMPHALLATRLGTYRACAESLNSTTRIATCC